jgi:hypothetical protein
MDNIIDMGNIIKFMTPFIIELINEFRNHNNEITPEDIQQRLQKKINDVQSKVDSILAEIEKGRTK